MRPHTQLGRLLVGILGVLLVVFLCLETTHCHPTGIGDQSAASHCQLCTTAHLALADQPSWLTPHVMHLISGVVVGEATRGSRIIVRTTFIRPPPAVGSSAA